MDSRRAAPQLGIVASSLVVVVLVVPYLVVDSAAVSSYYGAGTPTPWAAGLMALASVIIFAAGLKDRTDPETAAGAGVGLGLVVFLIALLWAVTVPSEVPLQLATDDPLVGPLTTGVVLEYHRWVLAAVSVLVPVAGGWYARALRLF
ncbi:DUF7548 family protein [Natronomonas amylolytica]|uniref:DUF7548 family protein n=1 Tax=Natronomonas amylolytica TaxID=3108498 RepID=UPI0030089C3A